MDRLALPLKHLMDLVALLDKNIVGFESLQGVHRHHHFKRQVGVPLLVRGFRSVRT